MRLHLFAIDNIMSRQISFDVSARTAKLIGKENFANANGAVIELIKNSYDADATVAMAVFYKDALIHYRQLKLNDRRYNYKQLDENWN